MPGLSVSLTSAAGALSSIQQAVEAVQNNIVNASTPGYAAVRVRFAAREFDVSRGLVGGVDVDLSSARDLYLEQSVRAATSALGLLQQQSPLLESIQNAFSASGDSGVPAALSAFSGSFAQLSASPNDPSLRANVLHAAATLVQAFRQTADQLSSIAAGVSQQASSTVDQINSLSAHIASLNTKIENGAQNDAGVAADLYSSLESLSQLANITVANHPDGTVSVLLDGQTPLVLKDRANALTIRSQPSDPHAAYPHAAPGIQLLDQNGDDVTGQASGGELGALLQTRNQTIPEYLGDQTHLGQLNELAKTMADRVNTILTQGQISAGPPPVNGVPLFTYDTTSDTDAAATLAVSSTITPDQIATINGASSNGVATELSDLTNPTNSLDLIDGLSYTTFYAQIAAAAGSASSQAAGDLQVQQDLTTQAQNQRTQLTGVSLNDQAAQLMSLQQAYQATARIITVLSALSQTTVNLIPEA